MSQLKQRLTSSQRKVITTVTIDDATVDFRRPTHPERLAVMEASKAAGEVDSAEKPTTAEGGLRMLARVIASVAYDPETQQRIFDPASAEDVTAIYNAPWLEDVQDKAVQAFRPSVGEVRKNS
ncbi:hypothetical protein JY651_07895 [Pyxidicoccus parkwayensis]|uniref:Phage tail assembly chaperone n=1 Tax=Pyxidicoccus parkwayensis TaxID=2813578 RepID=A0ABX7P331_9BACT|nr:hypothetical protein [Pyxidicoccus parkwaysis]QSQ24852.1 hypothetical protein JY651_07895 [Pyxidicoccus parkwaysis]